jgi:hypothetical protein
MLIRFGAQNYRSIREPAELSMVAVDRERQGVVSMPMIGESLLPVAGIFGANASGKSNVLGALVWLQEAVRESLLSWEDEIPVEPFAFGEGPSQSSEITLDLEVQGVRFEYILELDRTHVIYEALFHYPERRRRRVFEREGSDFRLQRGLGALAGVRKLIGPRTLVLSAARKFDEPLVGAFVGELLAMQRLGLSGGAAFSNSDGTRSSSTLRWFEDGPKTLSDVFDEVSAGPPFRTKDRALALLKLADLGIEDVALEELPPSPDGGRSGNGVSVELIHATQGGAASLPFGAESVGTQSWFRAIGPVLAALRQGSVLIWDELDRSLHPTLSAELIRLFESQESNPRGAQLLFTSHDTSLLNHLNRDEVWLTEKFSDGATRLGALSDFADSYVRKSERIESRYLQGRYGAIPHPSKTELLRQIGLVG